jgi:hypothetical protein
MNTIKKKLSKSILTLMMAALIIACVPASNVYAAGINDEVPPVDSTNVRRPLAKIWTRLQNQYERQGKRLERIEGFTTRLQNRLDTAVENGKDVTSIQAALDVFKDANADAITIHQEGEAIINAHEGFDADGMITDRPEAVKTVESLSDVLRETRDTLRNPFRLLRDAIQAFRQANQPSDNTTP